MNAELISLNYHVPQCDTSLCDFPVTIGRAADVEIHLDDHSVSNYHCRINEVDGRLTVLDLGSVHGTCVNSSLITEATLKPGDVLAIGMLSFLVQYDQTAIRNVRPHREAGNKRQADFVPSDVIAT
jgi:pSer/pThr/pTyr-binding forkhead associated (FHA) protein